MLIIKVHIVINKCKRAISFYELDMALFIADKDSKYSDKSHLSLKLSLILLRYNLKLFRCSLFSDE